ncbi:hypothetical protein [Thermococcus prieurii]
MEGATGLVAMLREDSNVLVVSALSGIIDALLRLAETGDPGLLERVLAEHSALADSLGADVSGLLSGLERAVGRRRYDPVWRNYILSSGERLSAVLFARTLENEGISLVLGRTEDWRLGTLVAEFGDDWPIVVHGLEGKTARIAVIGVEELPGWEGVRGNGYFSLAAERGSSLWFSGKYTG